MFAVLPNHYPVCARPLSSYHRYTQVSEVHRHSGRDCRNPEYRDV